MKLLDAQLLIEWNPQVGAETERERDGERVAAFSYSFLMYIHRLQFRQVFRLWPNILASGSMQL